MVPFVLALLLQAGPGGVPDEAWRCAAELEASACDAAVELELAPRWAARVRVFHTLVHDQGSDTDFETARRLLDEAIALAPDYALAHYRRASWLGEDAEESYRKVLGLRPDWVGPYLELARVLARERRYEEELEVLRRAETRASDDPALANAIVTALHRTNQDEALVPALKLVLELEPGRANHWLELGVALARLDRIAEAQDAYRQGSALANEPRTLARIAGRLSRLDDHDGAVSARIRALALVEADDTVDAVAAGRRGEASLHRTLCVNLVRGLIRLDRAHDAAARREQCRAPFLSAVRRSPDSVSAWLELGHTERELENLQLALEAYERARLLAPNRPRADMECARTLVLLGRHDEGLDILKHWVLEHPDDATYARTLGAVLESLGRIQEALSVYQRLSVHAANWDSPLSFAPFGGAGPELLVEAYTVLDARDAVADARLGHALERTGSFDEALAAYRRSVQAEPEAVWPEVQLALFLTRRRRLVEAGEAFARAERLDPGAFEALSGARRYRELAASRLEERP